MYVFFDISERKNRLSNRSESVNTLLGISINKNKQKPPLTGRLGISSLLPDLIFDGLDEVSSCILAAQAKCKPKGENKNVDNALKQGED